jgi:hypothetical protein
MSNSFGWSPPLRCQSKGWRTVRRLTIPAKGTGEPFGSLRTAARKRDFTPYRASDMKKRRYVGTALVRLWNSGCQSRSPNWRQRAHCWKRFSARQVQMTANIQTHAYVTSIPRALLVAIGPMLRWGVAIVVMGRCTRLPKSAGRRPGLHGSLLERLHASGPIRPARTEEQLVLARPGRVVRCRWNGPSSHGLSTLVCVCRLGGVYWLDLWSRHRRLAFEILRDLHVAVFEAFDVVPHDSVGASSSCCRASPELGRNLEPAPVETYRQLIANITQLHRHLRGSPCDSKKPSQTPSTFGCPPPSSWP